MELNRNAMKYAMLFAFLFHALIHSFGFLRAFGWAKLSEIALTPSPLFGILWLLAAVLLSLTAGLWWVGTANWWVVGAVAVLLSQFLIIGAWSDAKFGTFPNLLICGLLLAAYGGFRTERLAQQQEVAMIDRVSESGAITIGHLPPPVQRWLEASGALALDPADWVVLHQHSRMKLSVDQSSWYTADSRQLVTLSPPAFQWTVKMSMNPLVTVLGRDVFAGGKGFTNMKAGGIFSVAKSEDDPKIHEAALQRYLAEMVWYPWAATADNMEWTPIDDRSARATLTIGDVVGSGVFYFSKEGKFQQFKADRYRESGPEAKRTEWTVRVLKNGQFMGLKVPVLLQVDWQLKEGKWTWLEMEVTDIAYFRRND